VYGTVRSRVAQPGSGWSYVQGDAPPALEIERVLVPGVGEPKFVCRKKDVTGDQESAAFQILNLIIGWFGFSVVGFGIVFFYFRETLVEIVFNQMVAVNSRIADAQQKYKMSREENAIAGGKYSYFRGILIFPE